MNIIILLYYLVSFSVGMYSIGCIHTITKSNKNEIIKYYLIYYSSFTAFLGVFMIQAFISAFYQAPLSIMNLLSSLQFLSLFFSLLIFAVLMNNAFEVKYSGPINKVFTIFAVLWWLLCSLKEFLHPINPYIGHIIDDEWYLIILYLYILFTYLLYNRKKKGKKWYVDIRIIFFIVILSTPGLILDGLITEKGMLFYFTPAFMIIMSFMSLLFLNKYNLNVQETQYEISSDFRDRYAITERENEVINLLLKGFSYNKIADTLCISISTVRTHVMNIYKKTGVNSRYELYNKVN